MRYFDTHCHLNGDFYKSDIDADIKKALEHKIDKILIPGTNERDSLLAIQMAKQAPDVIFAAVGIHPSDAKSKKVCDYLKNINAKDIVAVGEIGIDLYHEENPALEIQEYVFRKHIEWAIAHKKPVLIHMRNATEEVYKIVSEYPKLKFVMHSFTADSKTALRFVQLGGYISFSGVVTFKNAAEVQDAARHVPLDRILIETDAPFLSPVPFRGHANKPEHVRFTSMKLAEIRGQDETYFANHVYQNSLDFFGIKGGK